MNRDKTICDGYRGFDFRQSERICVSCIYRMDDRFAGPPKVLLLVDEPVFHGFIDADVPFSRSAGGSLVALPFLETFAAPASAVAPPPKRVIFLGGGFGFTKNTF